MTNQTTTTRPAAVLMLPAVTATRAARIEAARGRHPIDSRPATWAAKPEQMPYCPAHLMTPAQLDQTARAAAINALQRRELMSGLRLMGQIIVSSKADQTAANLPDLAAQSLEHDRRHSYHRAKAESYQAIADRQTTEPETAKAARQAAKEHRRAAAEHLAERDSIDKLISTATHTDLADIISAAKLAIYEAIADPAADINGAYPAAVKAASKAIDTSAHATTLTKTSTKWESITPEQAAAWRAAHPAADKVSFNVRDSARAGFITLEYWQPQNTKRKSRRPVGWYLVKHYHTAPACISFEAFTDTEAGQAAIVKNGGINAIQTAQDAEDIAAIVTRANLTAKEQEICYKVLDQTAARHAEAASREYIEAAAARAAEQSKDTAAKTMRRARAKAPYIEAAAALESALDRSKVYADSTRRRYVANIRKALEAAQTPAAIQTAEEKAEAEAKAWEQMQKSGRRAAPAREARAADIIGAVARAAEAVTVAPAVAWLTDYPAPQTLTEEEAARARAAALDGYIWDKARAHQSRTPWSNAGQAAAVFMAYTMTADEVTAASKAARAADSAERDRAARAARIADSARKERERAARAKQDPAAAVAAWLARIGAADLADILAK